ncbi:hypothetical protein BA195_07505 [Tenacibaculum soleae]|uniref:TonB C-terminal domain-containing protein n=1 Tax=Tenacibaculum soleae TaxID=447689 RepID=A0A1B9XZ02_9FLAO|nr:hypothetical protein [Tenacibaculum soleae]OCK42749.1 hypothetical protein BA195_07505 [Tenacibaculum soleae]
MKKVLLLLILLVSFNGYSQKDSIVNYLDNNNEITKIKNRTLFIETKVNKGDKWLVKKFNRLGKLLTVGYYKDGDKKYAIGNHKTFFRGQKLTSDINYNSFGDYHGLIQTWFYNGAKNFIGTYENGYKVGVWKYYYLNGNIALREYYTKGKLIKKIVYNIDGVKNLQNPTILNEKLSYEGGMSMFHKRMSNIHDFIKFQVVGYIYLDFIVDIDGTISNVDILSNIPKALKKDIEIYLNNIKEFRPTISKGRKIPTHYIYPLNFRVVFNE